MEFGGEDSKIQRSGVRSPSPNAGHRNVLEVKLKKCPPEVADAIKRLGLPKSFLVRDLRIVSKYFEVLQEIRSIASNGRPQ